MLHIIFYLWENDPLDEKKKTWALIKSKCWIIWALIEEIFESSKSFMTLEYHLFFTGGKKQKGFSLKMIWSKSSIIFNRNIFENLALLTLKTCLKKIDNSLSCKFDKNGSVYVEFSVVGFFVVKELWYIFAIRCNYHHKGIIRAGSCHFNFAVYFRWLIREFCWFMFFKTVWRERNIQSIMLWEKSEYLMFSVYFFHS